MKKSFFIIVALVAFSVNQSFAYTGPTLPIATSCNQGVKSGSANVIGSNIYQYIMASVTVTNPTTSAAGIKVWLNGTRVIYINTNNNYWNNYNYLIMGQNNSISALIYAEGAGTTTSVGIWGEITY